MEYSKDSSKREIHSHKHHFKKGKEKKSNFTLQGRKKVKPVVLHSREVKSRMVKTNEEWFLSKGTKFTHLWLDSKAKKEGSRSEELQGTQKYKGS